MTDDTAPRPVRYPMDPAPAPAEELPYREDENAFRLESLPVTW